MPEFWLADEVKDAVVLKGDIWQDEKAVQAFSFLMKIYGAVHNCEFLMLELESPAGKSTIGVFHLLEPLKRGIICYNFEAGSI